MDGLATNLAMCSSLGASLMLPNNIRPYFEINGKKIYTLLDPCHMLKLARSTLSIYGSLNSPEGVIKWGYIEELANQQSKLGLHLANKLTSRHVNYENQKMKVIPVNELVI